MCANIQKNWQEGADSGDRTMTKELRRCLGNFATGVTVVTTIFDGRPVGVTANSFCSISLEPPIVSWAIGFNSRSYEAFRRTDAFTINILGADQVAVSEAFSSKNKDKFAGIDWSAGRSGVPVLDGVVAYLECERHSLVEVGDHLVIFGNVLSFDHASKQPLLFASGRYGTAEERPLLSR